MRRLSRTYRRFVSSTRGVAAIEFAMILPVLLLLFLASIDAGRAIAIYMKVRSATYTLDAITNQYTQIQSTDMTSILGATSVVLAPYSGSPAVVTISQISVTNAGASTGTVAWSATLNGTPLTQGATVSVPTAMTTSFTCSTSSPCYLIYGQVSYTYSPMFAFFITNAITLSDSLYVTPRSSACIVYVPQQTSTSCT